MRIVVLLTLLYASASASASATDVLTHHNDAARTGAILDEKVLTPASLKNQRFGKLFSLEVDGQIYAQPLVVTGLDISGKGRRDVLFVATMRNMVYAFDTEPGAGSPLWKVSLGAPMQYDRIPKDAAALIGQYNIRPFIGITSTPVIDRAKQRIYAIAKVAEPQCPGVEVASQACPVAYRIFTLDLASGAVINKSDIRIPMRHSNVPADDVARRHLQRPALLLANNRIYAAFGAHQDAVPYHGWVIGFDANTLQQLEPAFCTTPGGEMGGIWQAGSGPAADTDGNVYIMTANGSFDPHGRNQQYGNSFVKLSPDLVAIDWFAPANISALNLLDIDLGSAGPMLLPDTNELIGVGKESKLYLLSKSKLGGLQQRHWLRDQLNPPDQVLRVAKRWRLSWLSWFPLLFNAGYHHVHGSPVYWNSRSKGPTIYVWPEEDHVRAYRYDPTKKFNKKPVKGIVGNRGMPGGFLSISANGHDGGILWGAIPYEDDAWVQVVRGSLRAFDADTLELLWSSDQNEPGDHFDFAKNVPPTIANGRVYLATFSDRVNVYGLDSPVARSPQKPLPKVSKNPRHRGHVKGASGHGGHQPPQQR